MGVFGVAAVVAVVITQRMDSEMGEKKVSSYILSSSRRVGEGSKGNKHLPNTKSLNLDCSVLAVMLRVCAFLIKRRCYGVFGDLFSPLMLPLTLPHHHHNSVFYFEDDAENTSALEAGKSSRYPAKAKV